MTETEIADGKANVTIGFWIIGGIALVWNLMGVAAYVAQLTMSTDALAALPEAERALYEAMPAWATAAFALAVFGGALGSVLLLLRKKIALPVFVASLAGIVIQMSYNFLMANTMEVYGPGAIAMPVMVLAFAVFLVWYANRLTKRGLLT